MNRQRAIRLAIQALEAHRQQIAADANLADYYGADYAYARKASQARKEINQAIEELKAIIVELKAAQNKPILDEVKRKKKRSRPHQETQIPLFGGTDDHRGKH